MQRNKIIACSVGIVVWLVIICVAFVKKNQLFGENYDGLVGEFSASGTITKSELPGTPIGLGDATFGVYFKRESIGEKDITFEINVVANGETGETLTASVKDGTLALFTTGDVTDSRYLDVLPLGGMKLYNCDETFVDSQTWSKEYKITKVGDVLEVFLGGGGTVFLELDPLTGIPSAVKWGGVSGSFSTFHKDNSLKNKLGLKPPSCPGLQKVEDKWEDVSGLPDVEQSDAQTIIDGLTGRRMSELLYMSQDIYLLILVDSREISITI